VPNSETLLFIDDDEAEIGQLYIVRKNAVRADQNIDLAFRGCLSNGLLLLYSSESVRADRPSREKQRIVF
jgi:hypothetical protein